MFDKIESLILIGISINFNKDFYGFIIELNYNEKKEIVNLPYTHLNESQIIKYIDLMTEKILQ